MARVGKRERKNFIVKNAIIKTVIYVKMSANELGNMCEMFWSW